MIYELLAIGDFFLLFTLISTHLVLFIDVSPLQQHPTCSLNFIIAILTSAVIPSLFVRFINLSTSKAELLSGLTICVVLSLLTTLTIQKVNPVNIDFY